MTIIVDSVAAASTKKEMEADFGKDGNATDKAIIISKAMRKITGLLGRERITRIHQSTSSEDERTSVLRPVDNFWW